MDILSLLVAAPVLFILANKVSQYTKLAKPIFFIVIGILLGGSLGWMHLLGNPEVMPNLGIYNTNALLLMFFGAGFSLDINMIKNSGKTTAQLFSLPVHIEGIIMAGVLVLGLKMIPGLGVTLSYTEALIVAGTFAMASPAVVIPACIGYNTNGYSGKNNIPAAMIAQSIVDPFLPFPMLIVALMLSLGPVMGFELTGIKTLLLIAGVLIGLVVLVMAGLVAGFLMTRILDPIGKLVSKHKDKKHIVIGYVLLYFIITATIIHFSGPVKSMGVLIATAVGIAVKKYEKNNLSSSMGLMSTILFAAFGAPVIFMYVGSSLDLQVLLNPVMLIFGVVVTILAVLIKAFISGGYILRDQKFTSGERKFAAACAIPKGVTLLNLSVVFSGILNQAGMNYLTEFMIILGAIGVIASMPIGSTLVNNADKWLVKEEKTETSVQA